MEGFRILEITQPSELHVTANQLTVEQEITPKKKRKVTVPLEDLELIICTGANIRLSTMALSVLNYGYAIVRNTNNCKGAEKHLNRIKSYIPDTGTVRIMRLTEKQYCNMGLYQAEEDYQESIVGVNEYVML